MIRYLIYGVSTLVLFALAMWSPIEDTLADRLRSYFLVLLGMLLATFGIGGLLRRLGHGELTLDHGLLFATIGTATAVGAATRFRPYWQIASLWPLFAQMPERLRQVTFIAAGLLFLGLGIYGMLDARQAYITCRGQYQAAATEGDSLTALNAVPSVSLTPYDGARPFTCRRLFNAVTAS